MGNAQYGPVGASTIETRTNFSYRVLSFPEDVTEQDIARAIEEDEEHLASNNRRERLGDVGLYVGLATATRMGRDDLARFFLERGADPTWVPPLKEGYLDERREPLGPLR